MKFRTYKIFSILISLLIFSFLAKSASAAIVINEILPKVEDVGAQFIELYNNGTEAVSLNNWKIEQLGGEKKSFTLNASAMLQGKSFYVITGAQSGINMDRNGDTIKLLNENNKLMDSQSYVGVIGYFTAVGRSVDGAGIFIPCYVPTQGGSNNCPAPTATNTPPPPPPTNIPEPTFTTYPTQIPLPTQAVQTPNSIAIAEKTPMPIEDSAVLGSKDEKPTFSRNMLLAAGAIVISAMWMVGITAYNLGKKHK